MKRNQPSMCGPTALQTGVNAQPTAEMRKSVPISQSVFLRPHRSDGAPAVNTPMTVPIRAPDTISPCQNAERPNSAWMACSHPEITPESKPKRNPPMAATMTTYRSERFLEFFMPRIIPKNAALRQCRRFAGAHHPRSRKKHDGSEESPPYVTIATESSETSSMKRPCMLERK